MLQKWSFPGFDRIKKSGTGISDAALYSFTDN